MKLAHIPGETLAEAWRHRPFEPSSDFRMEDFDGAFQRAEDHVEGFGIDRDYLYAPLRALYFNMETEDFHRLGQKIIESAPHVSSYQWPEFDAKYVALLSRSRLRKPKEWHLAGELWIAIVRHALWPKVRRFALRYARTYQQASGFVFFDLGYSKATDCFIQTQGLDGLIWHDDPRLNLDPPLDPAVLLHLYPETKG